MRYGFVLSGGTATEQLEQAVLADQAGWDAVFPYETGYGVDPWTLLAAIAQRTRRVRLGTMLTPLPWRRPWKLASQVVTLDHLSGGRAILAVGTGATDAVLGTTDEPVDVLTRAELLDEGIDVIAGLWDGRLKFEGKHYHVDFEPRREEFERTARPIQQPRIPIWVVGAWPRPKSMRRVLRCDGLLPMVMDPKGQRDMAPEDIRAMLLWLEEQGGVRPGFDVIHGGETPPNDPTVAAASIAPWAEAGVTWWLESRWQVAGGPEEQRRVLRERIEAGPPRA
jgi:hypothetical protein